MHSILLLLQEKAPPPPGSAFLELLIPFALLILVFYFLLIRPQQKQQKERQAMIDALRKRDRIVTQGGIKGIVDRIRDNEITLIVDEKKEVRIRILKSSVALVEKRSDDEDEASGKPKVEKGKDGKSPDA